MPRHAQLKDKMNMIRFLPVLLLGFLAGCASTPLPEVATHIDRHTGIRTDIIPENLLESRAQPPRELLWLNASRVFKNQADFDYYLEVTYQATEETGYLNITPGPSLVVVADGKEMKFMGNGSLNTRKTRRGLVSEDAIFLAGPAELKDIANAKQVTVKVIGRNGIVERDFAPANFERFKKFVLYFVDAGG